MSVIECSLMKVPLYTVLPGIFLVSADCYRTIHTLGLFSAILAEVTHSSNANYMHTCLRPGNFVGCNEVVERIHNLATTVACKKVSRCMEALNKVKFLNLVSYKTEFFQASMAP